MQRSLQSFLQHKSFSPSILYAIVANSRIIGYCFMSHINKYRMPFLQSDGLEITIEIFPEFRKLGHGSKTIKYISQLPGTKYAFVRKNNFSSNNIFLKNSKLIGLAIKNRGVLGNKYYLKHN